MLIHRLKSRWSPVVRAGRYRSAPQASQCPYRSERIGKVEPARSVCAAPGCAARTHGTDLVHGRCRQLAVAGTGERPSPSPWKSWSAIHLVARSGTR